MSTRLRVRAVPGAGTSRVVGRYADGWKVRIAAAPEDGKANVELCRFLAKLLGVHARDVVVVTGNAARDKLVAIDGIEPDELERQLAEAAAP